MTFTQPPNYSWKSKLEEMEEGGLKYVGANSVSILFGFQLTLQKDFE